MPEPSADVHPQPLLCVADVPASSAWWCRLLGGTPGHDPDSGHGGKEYDRVLVGGRIVLHLHALAAAHHHGAMGDPDQPLGNGVAAWFALEDLDAGVARSRELGARVQTEVHVNPNAGQRELWLRDPDGYLVVLAEARESGAGERGVERARGSFVDRLGAGAEPDLREVERIRRARRCP